MTRLLTWRVLPPISRPRNGIIKGPRTGHAPKHNAWEMTGRSVTLPSFLEVVHTMKSIATTSLFCTSVVDHLWLYSSFEDLFGTPGWTDLPHIFGIFIRYCIHWVLPYEADLTKFCCWKYPCSEHWQMSNWANRPFLRSFPRIISEERWNRSKDMFTSWTSTSCVTT